jgi:hypothetical protein
MVSIELGHVPFSLFFLFLGLVVMAPTGLLEKCRAEHYGGAQCIRGQANAASKLRIYVIFDYIFPIFTDFSNIVGFKSREIDNEGVNKWSGKWEKLLEKYVKMTQMYIVPGCSLSNCACFREH